MGVTNNFAPSRRRLGGTRISLKNSSPTEKAVSYHFQRVAARYHTFDALLRAAGDLAQDHFTLERPKDD